MSLTYERLLSLNAKDVAHAYTEKSSMLYAVAIGMGVQPQTFWTPPPLQVCGEVQVPQV